MNLPDGILRLSATATPGTALTRLWIVALVLSSAAFLGWSVFRTLGPALAGPAAERSAMTVRALPHRTPEHEAEAGMVFVADLIPDGRAARIKGITRQGAWSETNEGTALYHFGVEEAALTFEAATVFALLLGWESGGVARFESGGKVLNEIDLRAPGEGTQVFIAAAPVSHPPTWALFAAVALSLGAALWLRPWDPHRTGEAWLVFWLSGLHLTVWLSQCVGTNGDSPGYRGVLEGYLNGVPEYFPPGYSLVVSFTELITSESLGAAVTLLQHAATVLAILWIFRMLRPCVGLGLAWLGALLTGVSWSALFLPQAIMSENLAFFGMTGCLYFAGRARSRAGRAVPAALASGAFLGIAVLARVVPFAALLPGILLLHLVPFSRRGLALGAVTLATGGLLVLAPIGWFWWKSGTPELTTSSGLHLWNRVVTSQRKLAQDGAATRKVLDLLDGSDPRGLPHWEVKETLMAKGLSYGEVVELFGRVAKEAILEAPLEFVTFSVDQAWRLFMADPIRTISPWGQSPNLDRELESPPLVPLSASAYRWRLFFERVHEAVWVPLCWLTLAGIALLWFLEERIVLLAIACIPPGYLFATANIEYFLPRYNVAVIPFMFAAAMVPFAALPRIVGKVLQRTSVSHAATTA